MDAAAFRRIVLGLIGVTEGAHMGHPDFRVGGRIFATLAADETTAMVKLTVDQQARFLDAHPSFRPASGSWGVQGATLIDLRRTNEEVAGEAATIAWQNLATATRAVRPSASASKRSGPPTTKR